MLHGHVNGSRHLKREEKKESRERKRKHREREII